MSKAEEARTPPGQYLTRDWPILHYGDVPRVNIDTFRFRVWGLVENPLDLSWNDLQSLPRTSQVMDIHCVTQWSRLDNQFDGIPVQELIRRANPKPEAKYVMAWSVTGWNTNLPLEDLDRPENLLATHHDGEPISPAHGFPVRLVVPHLYFWKSAKWCCGLEFMASDKPGFWERNGYHMRGDPWREERFDDD